MRRRWSDRTVQRSDGTRPACSVRAAPVAAPPVPGLRSMVVRDHIRHDIVELVDDTRDRWCSP